MGDSIGTEDNLERKLQLPLQYLKEITDNFSADREIGRGGFGVVYKGIEVQSGAVIAVKKLKPILGQQDKQFKNEFNLLARLSHDNIVKLIGYCDETKVKPVYDESQQKYIVAEVQDKLLCYEYLSKGSLDNIIFDESLGLDWQSRYKIVSGICQGLYYLHEGLDNTPIIHMDLKPSNILLDDTMMPKIGDFGLSRLFSEEQTRTCTMNVMGSIGYMAPEYYLRGEVSTKSDIYSLGILILEVVTGKKNRQAIGNKSGEHFIEDVRKNWTDLLQLESKYPSLGTDHLQQVHRCIEIGLSCVEADQERRPSASQILLHMLCGECSYSVDDQRQPDSIIRRAAPAPSPRSSFQGETQRILNRASTSDIESAINILTFLSNSRTSTSRTQRIINIFTFSANGRKIGILAFEVANAIVKGSSLMKSLSKQNIKHLKETVFRSKGVCRLIPGDDKHLLVHIEADIREELSRFATEVARFGNLCKDPQWYNLGRYFSRLQSELTPQEISNETLVSNIQYLMKLAQCTTELHEELLVLDKCEHDFLQCHQNKDETGRLDNRELNVKRSSLRHHRNVVKKLKRKSLMPKTMEDIVEKLVHMVEFMHLETNSAFFKNHGVQSVSPESNIHQALGPTGLALHYANVILQINALVYMCFSDALNTSPSAVPDKARDELYQALPRCIRSKLLVRWPKEKVGTAREVRARMKGILQWLVPIAESTRLYYMNGWEWTMKGMEDGREVNVHDETSPSAGPEERRIIVTHGNTKVNKIETLYYACKERTEAYILHLVRDLHHLVC